MADYRLYFMAGGHIMHAAEFVAADDAEALLHAEDQRDERDMELWNLDRIVARYPRR